MCACVWVCVDAYLAAKLSDCQPVVVMVTYEGHLTTTNKNRKESTRKFSVAVQWAGLANGRGRGS